MAFKCQYSFQKELWISPLTVEATTLSTGIFLHFLPQKERSLKLPPSKNFHGWN